jgi:nicotinamide mononucleotide adenylyltransferase
MKELEELVNRLQEALNQKEKELSSKQDYNAYLKGHIQNKQLEIQSFSNSIKDVSKDPFLKKEIINNFTKEANRIIEEIQLIKKEKV